MKKPGYADSVVMLQRLLKTWPEEPPSAFLRDDGAAAYYYDACGTRELRSFLNGDPDMEICGRFDLTPGEWREAVEMALIARIIAGRRVC